MFSPTSDNSDETCPEWEWEIAMGRRSISEEDRKKGRLIRNLDVLHGLDTAKQSKLTMGEVIVIVLYTGPMVTCTLC
jgi:hypothetical protein